MFALPTLLALLQATPQDGMPLDVQVLSSVSEPLAGVEVLVVEGYRGSLDGDIVFSRGYPDPELVTRGRTDDDGFARFRLPDPGNLVNVVSGTALLARLDGRWIAARSFDPYEFPVDGVVRLYAGASRGGVVRILDPRGDPVSGARVALFALRADDGCVALPPALREVAPTDERGEARFSQAARKDVAGMIVETEDYGVQRISAGRTVDGLAEVTLRRVGTVRGKVDPAGKTMPGGIAVEVQSVAPLGPDRRVPTELRRLSGYGKADCAPDGSFEVPALAEGATFLQVSTPRGWAVEWERAESSTVEAGGTLERQGRLIKSTLVHGTVREEGSGRPLAGVDLQLWTGSDARFVSTDESGRFQASVPPGRLTVRLRRIPSHCLSPKGRMSAFSVPAGVPEHELPPIELRRGRELAGRVVDHEGRPVAHAAVIARWTEQESAGSMTFTRIHRRLAFADDEGGFRLPGLQHDVVPEVHARGIGRASEPRAVELGGDLVVTLPSPVQAAGTRIRCRVTDGNGKPVTGATGSLFVFTPPRGRYAAQVRELEGEGRPEPRSGADGVLETETRLDPELSYGWIVTAPDGTSACSRLVAGRRGGERTVPDVRLRLTRNLEGRVVDSVGEPVGGARVFQAGGGPAATETTTARDGSFTLPGVYSGSVYVFAEADGHRFGGVYVSGDGSGVEIPLPRASDPLPPPPSPEVLPPEDGRGIARRLLDPYLDRALQARDASAMLRALQACAWVDAEATLRHLQRSAFPEVWYADFVLAEVVRALCVADPAEARLVVPRLRGPDRRAFSLMEVARNLPVGSEAGRAELLSEAFLQARACDEPQMRVAVFARIANAFFDLGEEENARRVLAVAAPVAHQLPDEEWPAYARCCYAQQLAKLDLEAALAITSTRRETFDWDRHHGNIAHELADRDPAAAERVFGMMKANSSRWLSRIAYRMAAADPDRAEKLIETSGAGVREKGYALGMMAGALADADRARARRLLEEAYAMLETEGHPQVAAALLPVVEGVEPGRLGEFAMRAVACRRPVEATSMRERTNSIEPIAQLAMMLARYYPEAARRVIAPVWEEAAVLVATDSASNALVPALAILDPERCARLVEGLRTPPDVGIVHPVNRAYLAAAKAMARRDPRRWDWLAEHYLGLWIVGKEDL